MSRYIDADALQRHGQRGGLVHWKDIAEAPSIDIVRCKECKEWDKNDHECYLDRGGLYFPNPDDYCSYGEREGE